MYLYKQERDEAKRPEWQSVPRSNGASRVGGVLEVSRQELPVLAHLRAVHDVGDGSVKAHEPGIRQGQHRRQQRGNEQPTVGYVGSHYPSHECE